MRSLSTTQFRTRDDNMRAREFISKNGKVVVPPNEKLWGQESSLGAGGENGEFHMGHLKGEVPVDDITAVDVQHLFPGWKYRMRPH